MAHLACLRRNQRRRFGHADRLRHRPRPKRDVQLELLVRVQKDSLLLELRESLQLCRHRIAADRKQVKGVAALGVAGHRPGGAGSLFGDRALRARHHRAARIENGARYASLRALREQCGSDRKGNKQSDKKHAGSAIHDSPSSDSRSTAPDAKGNKEQLKLKVKTSTRADASEGGYTRPAQYVKHALSTSLSPAQEAGTNRTRPAAADADGGYLSSGDVRFFGHLLPKLAIFPLSLLRFELRGQGEFPDRKSTRLNSSHGYISYAVFCLKKK